MTTTPARTASEIVEAARVEITRRRETLDPRDWTDRETFDRYEVVVSTLAVWRKDARTVVASVANTPDGRTWAYVAAEILDSVPTADAIFNRARIDQTGPVTYTLTW